MSCEKGVISPFIQSCEPFVGACTKTSVVGANIKCNGNCTVTISIEGAVGLVNGSVYARLIIPSEADEPIYVSVEISKFTDFPNGVHVLPVSELLCKQIVETNQQIMLYVSIPGQSSSETAYFNNPYCSSIIISDANLDCEQGTIDISVISDGVSSFFLVQVLIGGTWTTIQTVSSVEEGNITFDIPEGLDKGDYEFRIVDNDDRTIISLPVLLTLDCEEEETEITTLGFDCKSGAMASLIVTYGNASGNYTLQVYNSLSGEWDSFYTIGAFSGSGAFPYSWTTPYPAGTYDFRVVSDEGYVSSTYSNVTIPNCTEEHSPLSKFLILGHINFTPIGSGSGAGAMAVLFSPSIVTCAASMTAPVFGWVLERYEGGGVFSLIYAGIGNAGDFLSVTLEEGAEYRLQLQVTSDGLFASSRMLFLTNNVESESPIGLYISAGQTSQPNQPSNGKIKCHEDLVSSMVVSLPNPTTWEAFTPGGVPGTGYTIFGPDPVTTNSPVGVKWTSWFLSHPEIQAMILPYSFAQVDDNLAGSINQHMSSEL